MKHRLLEGALNPYKHHLWRLPSIPEAKQPESYPDKSHECVAVIPLFQGQPDDVALEHHLVRAACWSRRSWLLFSDAVELGIKIGFYVGDTVIDRVFPILEENRINIDSDVFIMNESVFEGDPVNCLGKKMSVFCDEQFLDYRWIVQLDCDLWLGSPNRDSLDFFQYVVTHDTVGIGSGTAHAEPYSAAPYANLEDTVWWKCLLDSDDKAAQCAVWIERARSLVGDVVEAYMDDDIWCIDGSGGIYTFPIQYYHSERPDLVDWVARAGQLLQDDEAVFSLWRMMGEPFYSISDELGVQSCFTVEDILSAHERGDVYFSHLANLCAEWFWREDADAL